VTTLTVRLPAHVALAPVDPARGKAWLGEGFALFRRAPGRWIVATLTLVLVVLGLRTVPAGNLVVFTIVTPPLTAGMALGCAELSAGRRLRAGQFFAGFAGARGRRLLALGFLTLVAYGVIGLVVAMLIGATLGADVMLSGDVRNAGWLLLALYWFVALSLWGVVVMATWFAPLLIYFDDASIPEALRGSWVGIRVNHSVATRYSLWLIVWSVAASLPAFIGWLAVGPAMVGSIYVSYRDIYASRP
jgi:hypothetical protein